MQKKKKKKNLVKINVYFHVVFQFLYEEIYIKNTHEKTKNKPNKQTKKINK